MVGTTVGKYRIVRKIGEGGMGVVYLAEHALIGRRAAVKVLLPTYSHDVHVVTRFFNEARAVASIKHAGLVDIYDFGTLDDGSAFLVMEWLAGESLAARVQRKGRLRPNFAVEIGRQLAGAMAAAHAQRIVHRDLKPDNVFLVPDADLPFGTRVKVLDFGVAKMADVAPGGLRTHSHAVLGTPAYMSPEQCRGAGSVDHRSDIYALGCILFELVTGRPPFTAEGMGELIADHLRTAPPSPRSLAPNVPADLSAIILRCLEKDPAARFSSMSIVADELGAQAARAPFAARPATPGSFAAPDEETEVDPGLALRILGGDWAEDPSTAGGGEAQIVGARRRKISTLDSAASESVQTMPWAARRRRVGVWLLAGGALATSVVGIVGVAHRPLATRHAAATLAKQATAVAATPVAATPVAAAPVAAPSHVAAPPIVAPAVVVTPLRLRLAIDSRPRGAEVSRAGRAVGHTPFSEEMAPARDEIVYTLKLAGYEDGEARFDGGGEQTIELLRKHASRTVAAPAAKPHALDDLHTKFLVLTGEYETFARQHGTALADRWNALAAKMTAGARDHIDEIDAMIDALRRDMSQLRAR